MATIPELLALAQAYARELPPAPPPLTMPGPGELPGWIDHTLLRPEATAEQIKKLCDEARTHRFATVCVNPAYVQLASGLLHGSNIGVCAVTAFPLGANLPAYKVHETLGVIDMGATEVDMVINIGAMKGEAYGMVLHEIQSVVEAAHSRNVKIKVILEMCYLNRIEKILGCLLSKEAGADFVKTSTGFGPGGATVEDVELMRRVVGPSMGVKAAGGIRTLANARAMIRAGADRLGASAGVTILQEALQEG